MENKLKSIIMDVSKVVHLKDTNKEKIVKMGEIYKNNSKLGLKGIKQNYDKKGMNELLR